AGASAGFEPEPFTGLHQRSLYQSTRGLMASVFPALQRKVDSLQDGVREEARTVLGLEPEVLRRFQSILHGQLTGMRIRCHGEYLHAMGESPVVPRRQDELSKLLSVLVLEKAVYEVDYELNNRPDWLRIPLRGVIQEIKHHH